jgi:2-dehydropantoate 2-reductase
MRSTRVVVIGAGAIGGLVAGYASNAGHSVTAIDVWEDHVRAITLNGLTVSGARGEHRFPMKALLPSTGLEEVHEPDIIVISVKSQATSEAAELAARLVGPTSTVLSTQNGINEDLLAERLGASRVIGVVTEVGARVARPGTIIETRTGGGFVIGEMDGAHTPRLRETRDVLSACAPVEVTSTIRGVLWSKLTWNCMMNPLTAVTGLGQGYVWTLEPLHRAAVAIAREAAAVAAAEGALLEPLSFLGVDLPGLVSDEREAAQSALRATQRQYHSQLDRPTSMLEDIRHGRLTEVDYLNGYVVRRARCHGVATPLNAMVVELVHAVEQGAEAPRPRLVAALADAV